MVIAVFSIGNFADAFLILKAESAGVAKEYILPYTSPSI